MELSVIKFEKILNFLSLLALILLQFNFVRTNTIISNIMAFIVLCIFVGYIISSAISINIIKKENGSLKKIASRYFLISFMAILIGILLYIKL